MSSFALHRIVYHHFIPLKIPQWGKLIIICDYVISQFAKLSHDNCDHTIFGDRYNFFANIFCHMLYECISFLSAWFIIICIICQCITISYTKIPMNLFDQLWYHRQFDSLVCIYRTFTGVMKIYLYLYNTHLTSKSRLFDVLLWDHLIRSMKNRLKSRKLLINCIAFN